MTARWSLDICGKSGERNQIKFPSWDRRGNEPRDERSECKPDRAQPVRNEASGVVLHKRERSEPPYISAQRSLLKNQGCAVARLQWMLATLALFSTNPLASFLTGCALSGLHSLRSSLGSPPLLSQEGNFETRVSTA
jgi:hypothetical protein